MSFEIRGTKENPYHLSVGAVVSHDGKYALIQKSNGLYTLPRETIYSNESIEGALVRGMSEELGVLIKVHVFLGSLQTVFNRLDGAEINKTTVYFHCTQIGKSQRNPEDYEVDDKILWVDKDELIQRLQSGNNSEAEIVSRL